MHQVRISETQDPGQILRKTPIFRQLQHDEILDLLNRSTLLRFEPQEPIIEEHSTDDAMYVVLDKTVSVHVMREGRQVYICTLGPGEAFGEAGLFLDFKRTASVIANERVTVMQLRREQFLDAIREDKSVGIRILMSVVHGLLRKLRETNLELAFERRSDVEQGSVDDLVDQFLGGADQG